MPQILQMSTSGALAKLEYMCLNFLLMRFEDFLNLERIVG